MERHLIEIYRDLIEIGRNIISTNHITDNWCRGPIEIHHNAIRANDIPKNRSEFN